MYKKSPYNFWLSTFTYINHIPSSTLSVVASITFQFSGCNSFLKADGLLGSIFFSSESLNFSPNAHFLQDFHLK